MTDSSEMPEQAEPAEATPPASSHTPSHTPTRGLRIARALLAPVLVLGAVGVHFSLNVPDQKVVMPKKDKAKKKRPRTKSRAAVAERSDAQLDAAWKRWSVEPYDGEPIKGKWGRRMQSSVNKAVVLARKEAFDGAPEDPRVVVSGTQCRTIRCRLILRSPYAHEPNLVVEALRRQTYQGKPLWRMVEAEPTDPPKPHSPKKDHYLQVTLGISFDALETKEIGFDGVKPKADKPKVEPGTKAKPDVQHMPAVVTPMKKVETTEKTEKAAAQP